MVLELVGVAEIAALLGVSRQRVHAIIATDASFPPPAAVLSAGKVWERSTIDEWIASRRDLA